MITMDKGIIMIMGTDDVRNCHWVRAIEDEIKARNVEYGIYNGDDDEFFHKIVSIQGKDTD